MLTTVLNAKPYLHRAASLLGTHRSHVLVISGDDPAETLDAVRGEFAPALAPHGFDFIGLEGDASDPWERLASAIHRLASAPFLLKTPVGEQTIDLTGALLGNADWLAYWSAVQDGDGIEDSLRHLAICLPNTQVAVVTVGAEVDPRILALMTAVHTAPFDARILAVITTDALPAVVAAAPFASTATIT